MPTWKQVGDDKYELLDDASGHLATVERSTVDTGDGINFWSVSSILVDDSEGEVSVMAETSDEMKTKVVRMFDKIFNSLSKLPGDFDNKHRPSNN